MTRFRHHVSSRRKIYSGVATAQTPLPEGKVRCPGCGKPVTLMDNGRIREHKDLDKNPCPHRWYGKPVELDEIPPVQLPKAPPAAEPPSTRMYVPPPPNTGPTRVVTGHCHDCDRRISGGRLFCGQCLRKRGKV